MAGEDLEKLAREAFRERCKTTPDAASAAVAVAREFVAAGRAGTHKGGPSVIFAAATAGVLSGILIAHGDLAGGSMRLLRELPDASHTQDPMKTMGWIMDGIAKVAMLAGAEVCAAIEAQIDVDLMGAGAVFHEHCDKYRP